MHIFSLAEAGNVQAATHAHAGGSAEGAHAEAGAGAEQHASNCRSSLSFMGSVVNYFNSEWCTPLAPCRRRTRTVVMAEAQVVCALPAARRRRRADDLLLRLRTAHHPRRDRRGVCRRPPPLSTARASRVARLTRLAAAPRGRHVHAGLYKPDGAAGQECEPGATLSFAAEEGAGDAEESGGALDMGVLVMSNDEGDGAPEN